MISKVELTQQSDGSLFRLHGQWTAQPQGDDGQFHFWLDDQLAFEPHVWWKARAGCGYITIGRSLHTVLGASEPCQRFTPHLLSWLVSHYHRTTEHG